MFQAHPSKPKFQVFDDGGWTKFSDFHWQRELNEKLLDYWPTKSKFRFGGVTYTGDVQEFLVSQQANPRECTSDGLLHTAVNLLNDNLHVEMDTSTGEITFPTDWDRRVYEFIQSLPVETK